MLQLFLYYLCFILSIVGIVLTFHFDGVAETIMGTVVNVCCAVVLFFRSLYAHDVYMDLLWSQSSSCCDNYNNLISVPYKRDIALC